MGEDAKEKQVAYLVRCWSECDDLQAVWRFSVEVVLPDRRRHGFNNLDELIAFLQAHIDEITYGGSS